MFGFLPFLVIAAASLFASKRMSDVQGRRVQRSQDDQRLEMRKQESAIAAQEGRAKTEREQLQREESDKIRGAQRKGRRSLLYSDETGVQSGLRTTLG